MLLVYIIIGTYERISRIYVVTFYVWRTHVTNVANTRKTHLGLM